MTDFRREIVDLLPRLRRLAWAIVRDQHDREDLVQRTVERALSRRDAFASGSRLDVWMFRIMKNIWIDEIRSRQRWGKLVQPLAQDFDPGDEGEGMTSLAERMDAQRLRAMVEKLPEDQRLAVKLTLLGEHSYQEAAEILGIPEGTLTSRLARGRAALLRQYQRKER